MNPVALYFASGESFYAGTTLLLLMAVVSPLLKRGWMWRLRNLVACFGLALIVMACPPFSWIVDLIFFVMFVAWMVLVNRNGESLLTLRWRAGVPAGLCTLLLALATLEISHRAIPVIIGVPGDHLVVIGDSISSGIDSRVPSWPIVMQQMTGIKVKNLARPGAQARDGMVMAEEVLPEDLVVLIEIGGNDLLSGVPSDEFESALDAILSKLAGPGRTVVMFELPLLPHKITYGQIQRRLAKKYDVALIPKRYFAGVIGGENATSDGLHLSETGSRGMAMLVSQVLSRVLRAPERQPGM